MCSYTSKKVGAGAAATIDNASDKIPMSWKWNLIASIIFHFVACIIVLFFDANAKRASAPEQSVEIEIVPTLPGPLSSSDVNQGSTLGLASPKSAETPSVLPNEFVPPASASLTAAKAEHARPVVVKPSHMLSEEAQAGPGVGKAVRLLAQLAPNDRIEQLCGLEAMEQVSAWNQAYAPDRVIGYAMADPKLSGNLLIADGAAMHSKNEWYRLKFRCKLTANRSKVAAFEFLVGDAIPRKMWTRHNLPTEEAGSLDGKP